MTDLRRRRLLAAAGAMLAPRVACPQSGDRMRIGVLARAAPLGPIVGLPFAAALRGRGWSEGSSFVMEQRAVGRDPLVARAAARELVDSRVDVIVAFSTMAAIAAKQTTSTVPIVTWCGYPVES